MTYPSEQWPSLREQLEEAHAPAGSALERLIRDNQDVSVLPEGEEDPLGLPLWLKVLWRKSHPEIDESNGLVAYPLILGNMLEWAREHPTDPVPGLTGYRDDDAPEGEE